jgi:hypothetical protein
LKRADLGGDGREVSGAGYSILIDLRIRKAGFLISHEKPRKRGTKYLRLPIKGDGKPWVMK